LTQFVGFKLCNFHYFERKEAEMKAFIVFSTAIGNRLEIRTQLDEGIVNVCPWMELFLATL